MEFHWSLILAFLALAAIVLAINWISGKSRVEKLEKQVRALEKHLDQKNDELDQLKAERTKFILKPHSLKNTIAGVRGMVRDTLKSVESLTGLLDYMLYDNEEKYVELQKDINFTKDLFNLYKNSVNPNSVCQFIVSDNVLSEFGNKKVMPWAFVPILENAFVHGDKESIDFELKINISIKEGNWICCNITNTMNPNHSVSEGIGLGTLEERIKLFYSENQYLVSSNQEDEKWISVLELQLIA